MPFTNDQNGFQNETNFIKKINNKRIKDLDFSLQLFITDLFNIKDYKQKIICYKNDGKQKTDIFIKIDNETKRISIKKGIKNSLHCEPISELIHFLIKNKMPKNLIIEFLKYHYTDNTTNGTGKIRISIEEYKKNHQNEIDKINQYINQKKILKKSIDRFILQGRNSKYKIDAIIYGVPEDFIWIKRNDIYKILMKKRKNYSSAIHFSNMIYQPLNRCLNQNKKYEKDRFISQIKWYSIFDDIIENMNDNTMNKITFK